MQNVIPSDVVADFIVACVIAHRVTIDRTATGVCNLFGEKKGPLLRGPCARSRRLFRWIGGGFQSTAVSEGPLFYEVRNSKGRKVRSWYIEAGGIHPHLSNRLLPNLPQAAENNS